MRQPDPKPGQQAVAPAVLEALQAACRLHVNTEGLWPWLDRRMRERIEGGRQKYGVLLETHNGRDALEDAWQEAADLVQYLTQAALEETRPQGAVAASGILNDARQLFLRISRTLWERDERKGLTLTQEITVVEASDWGAYEQIGQAIEQFRGDQRAVDEMTIFGMALPADVAERVKHWGSEPDRWDGWQGGSEPE